MAQVTQYSEFYTQMLTSLPGCETHLILQALQRMGREFARKTQAFRENLDPIAVNGYQQDYTLDHNYNANIFRILYVQVNQAKQKPEWFLLRHNTSIRFVDGYAPNDDLPNTLLTCGSIGTSTIGGWTSISDGAVGVTVDSAYGLTDLDFSSDDDFDDVALTIQTALRVAMDSNVAFVRPIYDSSNDITKFVVFTHGGTVSYLTAGSEGTDISGAGYMNGLTGTGVLSAMIESQVVLLPELNTDTMPDWFLERFSDAIIGGAMWWLAKQTKMPWGDLQLAADGLIDYKRGLAQALQYNQKQGRNGAADFDLDDADFDADYYTGGRSIENWR